MTECDFAFYSDVGGRSNNEDAYLAKKIQEDYLFIVADGLGGHEDGEKASRAAVDAVKEYILKHGGADIRGAVEFANDVVVSAQRQADSKMKTTIAIAYVKADRTIFAHVGDTRIYAFRNGRIVFQTIDHSVSQLAVSVGEIKAEDIRGHWDRNVLTRALGAAESVRVDVAEVANEEYDSLLLCSDGFWEYVLEKEMCETREGSGAADLWLLKMRKIQLDRAPEKCDNNTAVAVIKQSFI